MFSFFARQCAIVFGCFFSYASVFAQTLMPGDLVIVGYNFKDPDEFSMLPLVRLQAGTQIFITDCGWNANTSAFRPGEGLITFTVPIGGIEAGQQIVYPNDAGFVTQGISGFFGLSLAGDQLLIFQGSFASPQFVFGLTDYNGGWLGTSFTPTNQSSNLPPGLTSGQNALELDLYLQARFECAFPFSNRDEFLKRVSNQTQWIKSPERVILPIMGCGFDVLSENTLGWNYKLEYDNRLLLFVSSPASMTEISWWYYTGEGPSALTCRQIGDYAFECNLPEKASDFLLIRPCLMNVHHCELYKRIDKPLKTDVFWYQKGEGTISIVIPETQTVTEATLHKADGSVIWQNRMLTSGEIEIKQLQPGFYVLTLELAQLMYKIPVSLSE